MLQIRIHGRGGQGVVTAAEMLSVAAFEQGRHAQAFPSFGSERTGAPVVAFCRIDDREIRLREPILAARRADRAGPDAAAPGRRFPGAAAGRLCPDQQQAQLRRARPGRHRRALPPRAPDHGAGHRDRAQAPGPPLPNAVLLGGFAALSGLVTLEAGGGTRSARNSAARWPTATSPPPPQRFDFVQKPNGGVGPCSSKLKAPRPSPKRWRLCRPEVICAYPISPQTHIVEGLGELVKSGALAPCEFINVESEFAAMSVAIGSSAAGARTYTATASQGLLFMAEARLQRVRAWGCRS